LEKEPQNAAFIDSLGWVYYQQGRYEEALEKLKEAASKMDDPVIFDHVGDAYYKLNDKENALKYYEKALEMDPEKEEIKEKIKKLEN